MNRVKPNRASVVDSHHAADLGLGRLWLRFRWFTSARLLAFFLNLPLLSRIVGLPLLSRIVIRQAWHPC